MRAVIVLTGLATVFCYALFSPRAAPLINFWWLMTGATGVLAISALVLARDRLNRLSLRFWHIPLGVGSALLLYYIFYVGDFISAVLFDFARPQINAIYATKFQASTATIGILLVTWIGPAEEIFWRGFIQHRVSERFGVFWGFLITVLLYAGVHLWAQNTMMFLAALVAGSFWGAMYAWFKTIWPGIISHALWALAIFIIWPVL